MSTHLTYLHMNADDTLYVVLVTHGGQAWNGTALATFSAGNWSTYAITGAIVSGYLYGFDLTGLPPGDYQTLLHRRVGATPAVDDPQLARLALGWTGAAVAGVEDFKATGFSTHNAADVWTQATRTLTAFGFDVNLNAAYDAAKTAADATDLTAVKTVTDKVDDTLELDGFTYRFTAAALAEAPSGAGVGAKAYTVTVDDGTNPLDGVDVWVTSDVAGTSVVASGYTDGLGQIIFQLDPGTYYLWKQLAGYNFTNPETITVT